MVHYTYGPHFQFGRHRGSDRVRGREWVNGSNWVRAKYWIRGSDLVREGASHKVFQNMSIIHVIFTQDSYNHSHSSVHCTNIEIWMNHKNHSSGP